MTLTEALRALAAAGKICNPWPPGMRVIITDPRCLGPDGIDAGRIVASNARGIQILEWEVGVGRRTFAHDQVPSHFLPDLTDPATVGCLLSLLREAAGGVVFVEYRGNSLRSVNAWLIRPHGYSYADPGVWGEDGLPAENTEGEAIAAALIQLARQL